LNDTLGSALRAAHRVAKPERWAAND